jgi:hypothetical protein
MELIVGNFMVPDILVLIVLIQIFMVRDTMFVLIIFFIVSLYGFIYFLSDWEGIVIHNYVLDFIVTEIKFLDVDDVVKFLNCFNRLIFSGVKVL